jgi:hypothetical protein
LQADLQLSTFQEESMKKQHVEFMVKQQSLQHLKVYGHPIVLRKVFKIGDLINFLKILLHMKQD